jgi:hypothetical protein
VAQVLLEPELHVHASVHGDERGESKLLPRQTEPVCGAVDGCLRGDCFQLGLCRLTRLPGRESMWHTLEGKFDHGSAANACVEPCSNAPSQQKDDQNDDQQAGSATHVVIAGPESVSTSTEKENKKNDDKDAHGVLC